MDQSIRQSTPLRSYLAAACAVFLIPASLDVYPDELSVHESLRPLRQAIASLSEQASANWAYTRESHDEIGHYVERFDPAASQDNKWALLEFEGQAPGSKHLKRYRREYESLFERDAPTDVDLEGLIDFEAVSISARRGNLFSYEFQPLAEDTDEIEMMQYLEGTIVVDVERNAVVSVDIQNNRAFSPAQFVKINTVSMGLRFEIQENDGLVFLVESTSTTEGRFMGFKKIAEDERVQFRDFVERSGLDTNATEIPALTQ